VNDDVRRILITGASRGIGAALARELARRGFPLALTYRTGAGEALAVAEECLRLGAPQASTHHVDLLDNDSIARFAATSPDVATLVHNAGAIDWTPFEESTAEAIERVVRSNVEGPLKLTAALLGKVRDAIVVVASDVSLEPHPGLVVYSASKAALRAAAIALAKGRERPRVLVVHPTRTATAMNGFEGRDPAEVARSIADAMERPGLATGSEAAV